MPGRLTIGLGARRGFSTAIGVCLSLSLCASFAAARDAGSKAPPAAAEAPFDDSNLPMIIVVSQRSAATPVKRNEPDTLMGVGFRELLHSTKKFRVFNYSPTQPSIKRALLEHTLLASDLVPPIKADVLQRMGQTLGANYVFSFSVTEDKEGMKTDVLIQESLNRMDWRTLLSEKMSVPTNLGKRKLKANEQVALTVDTIATRLGYTPLAWQAISTKELQAKLDEANRQAEEAAGKQKTGEGKGRKATAADQPGKSDKTADTHTADKSADKVVPNAGKTAPADGGSPPRTTGPAHDVVPPTIDVPPAAPDKTNAAAKPGKQTVVPNLPPKDLLPDFTNSADPSRGRTDALPQTNAHPSAVFHADNEELALRFRQQGDLANVITSLRHAINDRPREIGLRRQLIQAYQDRKLLDAAVAETGRALLIAPNDSGLHRLLGDSLLGHSDVQGALKEYREAMRLNPGDVSAQVALGDALLADNQFTEAETAYQAAIKSDPKSPLPHRRMARALAITATADPARYALSLAHIQEARSLLSPTDAETYAEDYLGLADIADKRMRDLLTELEANHQAALNGKSGGDLERATTDMRKRAEGLADYLDKLPPAAGQDKTHPHFQQAAAFLLQALSLFAEYRTKGDSQTQEAMNGAIVDARRELNTAARLLHANQLRRSTDRSSSSAQTLH